MSPKKHALLSASSAHRWMHCTASPRYEESLPDSTSTYAEEGSLAHEIAELKVNKRFLGMHGRTFNSKLNKLKQSPLYTAEMDSATDTYIEHLNDIFMSFDAEPTVAVEVRVDFSGYVPEGFGTCDCAMIGGDTLSIIDLKYGKGCPVSAENNPQMRLYALGALERYAAVYGDTIKQITMSIVQPRLNSFTTDTLSVEQLREWGDGVKITAQKAYLGLGEFVPGEHCRFCRGRAQCRARANIHTALEDFKDCVPAGAASAATATAATMDADSPLRFLSDEEVGDLLIRGQHLVQWYDDLKEYATSRLTSGKPVKGWKLVAGRSVRKFSNQDAAFEAAKSTGIEESMLYIRKPISLSDMEKLMGKKAFADTVGAFVVKPPGAPTLAMESDPRPPYSSAASDFADVVSTDAAE